MANKFTNIKERILYLCEFQGIKKEKFFEEIGVSYGNFKGNAKNTPINSNSLANIIAKYPKINSHWLLTGNGDMLVNTVVSEHKGIPIIPLEAFAGKGFELTEGVSFDTIEERYTVPLFKGITVDFMIPVKGSSMYPKYASGDVVACRFVKEIVFIQWNKVYVLDTISQGTILKRLKKSDRKGYVICKSDNKDYDEFELPVSEIRNIALVVGVIRLE